MPLYNPISSAGAHVHAIGDTTNLQTVIDGKSASSHNHAGTYEPANANIQAHVVSAHAPANAQANVDITKAEIEAKLTGQIASHTHAGGSEAFPIGSVFIAVVDTSPTTLLGYGTWATFGAGRVLVGLNAVDTDFDTAEETGGSKTASHAAHSGTAVAAHAVTQPSNHVFTQPSGHSNHVFTQPDAHTEVINHTHPVTDPGHTHLTQRYPTATGGSSGFTIDTSMSGTLADNTLPTKMNTTGITTNNPAGGVASLAHANGAVDAHSAHAGGAVDAHSGTAVDAHQVTQPSTHAEHSVVQPYIVVYMWKRTA